MTEAKDYLLKSWPIRFMWIPVTTAWHPLGLWMVKTASRYGGQFRIYWISSRAQQKRGGPPAWELDEALTTPHRKKSASYEMLHRTSALNGLIGTT